MQHCTGIGPARLAELRALGIHCWDDALAAADHIPPSFRDALLHECGRCRTALAEEDVQYFVDHFAPPDKWRILAHFLDRVTFFDIETTGLDLDATISVVVCWHRGRLCRFIEHENLDDFLDLLDDVTLLASFNGSSFDVPRVLDTFHIPHLPCPHLDLRWLCYHQGLRGSLKRITQTLGFQRPVDLHTADGALAVELWERWRGERDEDSRSRLIRYCAADVLLLVMLAHRVSGRCLSGLSELWSQLPPEPAGDAAPEPLSFTLRPLQSGFGTASPRSASRAATATRMISPRKTSNTERTPRIRRAAALDMRGSACHLCGSQKRV